MDNKRPQRAVTGKSGKRGVSASPIVPEVVVPEVVVPEVVVPEVAVRREPKPAAAVLPEVSASSTIAMSAALSDETPAPVVTITEAPAVSEPVPAASSAEPVAEAEPVVADAPSADVEAAASSVTVSEPATVAAPFEPPVYSEPAPEAASAPETAITPQLPTSPVFAGHSVFQSHKDMIMDMSTNFGSGINDALAGAQDKAKEAFEKSTSMLGEAGSFARGNVEAVVESGKILAAGLQDMSTNLVAEGRGAFETMTADLKELAASKTPADFFKVQGEMMRKSLDSMVAYGSKNSEAMLKLTSDVIAPLAGRANVAVEKAKMPTV